MNNFKVLIFATVVILFAIFIFSIILTKSKGFTIDYKLRDFFRYDKYSDLKKVFNKATILANVETVGIIAFPIIFFLVYNKDYVRATSIVLSIVTSVGISQILKAIFKVKRPTESQEYEFIGYSFPSGHSTVGMSFYLTLTILMANPAGSLNGLIILGFLIGSAIGISRIVLGVHWFTDVTVGLILGLLCSLWSVYLYSIGFYFSWLFI